MIKSISSLVDDIYGLFKKDDGHISDPNNLEALSRGIAEVVAQRLAVRREDERPKLRFSNIGRKDRQLWYELNRPELKEKIPPYVKIKFLYGDILEALLLFLAKEAGHEVVDEQLELDIDGIKGHIDAKIDGVIVDVKSASTFSFNKFKDGSLLTNDPFGYVGQVSSYAVASNTAEKGAAFLAIDKTLGHLTTLVIKPDIVKEYDPVQRIQHVKEVIQSPEPPVRCYFPKEQGKSGNLVLDTGCSYCGFKDECWKDSNGGRGLRTFLYASGPVHFVEVLNEPKVQEV